MPMPGLCIYALHICACACTLTHTCMHASLGDSCLEHFLLNFPSLKEKTTFGALASVQLTLIRQTPVFTRPSRTFLTVLQDSSYYSILHNIKAIPKIYDYGACTVLIYKGHSKDMRCMRSMIMMLVPKVQY